MLDVLVVTADKVVFEGKAERVIVPGNEGVFEIQRFHHPIISLLLPGNMLVDDTPIPIERGVVSVDQDTVTAVVEG